MECILPAFDKMAFSVDGPKGTVAASGGSLGAKAPLSAGCGMLPGKALPRWERPTNKHTQRYDNIVLLERLTAWSLCFNLAVTVFWRILRQFSGNKSHVRSLRQLEKPVFLVELLQPSGGGCVLKEDDWIVHGWLALRHACQQRE